MKRYEFNYKNGSYVFHNSPRLNPLWVAAALGILAAVLTLFYN